MTVNLNKSGKVPKTLKISKGALEKLFVYANLCRFNIHGNYDPKNGEVYEIYAYAIHNFNRGGDPDLINDILIPPGQYATGCTVDIVDTEAEAEFLKNLPEKGCFVLGWAHSHAALSFTTHSGKDENNLIAILHNLDRLDNRGITTFEYKDTEFSKKAPIEVKIRIQTKDGADDKTLEETIVTLENANYLYDNLSNLKAAQPKNIKASVKEHITYFNTKISQYQTISHSLIRMSINKDVYNNASKLKGEIYELSHAIGISKLHYDFSYTHVKNGKELYLNINKIKENCLDITEQIQEFSNGVDPNSYLGITLNEKLPKIKVLKEELLKSINSYQKLMSDMDIIKNEILAHFLTIITENPSKETIDSTLSILNGNVENNPFNGGFLVPSWETFAYSIVVNKNRNTTGYIVTAKSSFVSQNPVVSEIKEINVQVIDGIDNDVKIEAGTIEKEIKECVRVTNSYISHEINEKPIYLRRKARFSGGDTNDK